MALQRVNASGAIPPNNFIPLNTLSLTFSAAWPAPACIIPVIFVIPDAAPPNPNGEDDKLEGGPPDCCEFGPTEEENCLFALGWRFDTEAGGDRGDAV